MKVEPYLMFNGRCEEAIEFYRKALGAQVDALMRFKDAPQDSGGEGCGPQGAPPPADKIMHAAFRIGETTVMASDGMSQDGKPSFQGISLAISVANPAEAERYFSALAEGGQVHQPLMKTFFAASFGVIADRFGVSWMIVAEPAA